jgi:hypothetical protein
VEVSADKLVSIFDRAEELLDDLGDFLSDKERGFIEDTMKSRAVLMPNMTSHQLWNPSLVTLQETETLNIIETAQECETSLAKRKLGWLDYPDNTRTVCTGIQMVTFPSK